MHNLTTAITLTTALLTGGCIRAQTGRTYYDNKTRTYVTEYNKQTQQQQKHTKGSFEDILSHHKYAVFKKYGETQKPVRIIADVEHTSEIRRKNNTLLKDLLKKDDLLLVEGYLGGITYPDLEERLFTTLKTPQEFQKTVKQLTQEGKKQKNINDENSYFNQGFPCKIESSDDDVIAYVCNMIYQDIEDLNSLNPEQAKTVMYAFNQSLHYRNLAMARTITQKIKENPATQIYQVIGMQHAVSNDELRKLGGSRPAYMNEFSGELCKLLETEKIPYVVITPTDFDY